MKFKPGQLVRKKARKGDPDAIYYVLDASYPKMLIHCVESLFDFMQGKSYEVGVGECELITDYR
jgi:hypothetical protein